MRSHTEPPRTSPRDPHVAIARRVAAGMVLAIALLTSRCVTPRRGAGAQCGSSGASVCLAGRQCVVDTDGCEVCRCGGSTSSRPQNYYRPGATPQGGVREDPMSP